MIAELGRGYLTDLAWSPDGMQIAAGSSIGLYVFSASTLEQLWFLPTDGRIRTVDFTPDGTRLLILAGDDAILVDAQARAPIITVSGEGGFLRALTLSPDGQYIAGKTTDYSCDVIEDADTLVWNAKTGSRLFRFEEDPVFLRFDAESRLMGLSDGKLFRWDLLDGTLLEEMDLDYLPTVLDVSQDGKIAATQSSDDRIEYREIASGILLSSLPAQFADHMGFLSGHLIAIGSGEHIFLYDLLANKEVAIWDERDGEIYGIRMSPDGTRAITVGEDTLQLRSFQAGGILAETGGFAGGSDAVIFDPTGEMIAVAHNDGQVKLWSLAEKEAVLTLDYFDNEEAGQPIPNQLVFSPDGQWLAAADYNADVVVWHLPEPKPAAVFSFRSPVISLEFSGDNVALYMVTESLWRFHRWVLSNDPREGLEDMTSLVELSLEQWKQLDSVGRSEFIAVAASHSETEPIFLWRPEDPVQIYELPDSWAHDAVYDPVRDVIAVGIFWSWEVELRSFPGNSLIHTFENRVGEPWSLTYLAQPDIFVWSVYNRFCGNDGIYVQYGDPLDGGIHDISAEQTGTVWSVAVDPSGRLLATVGSDGVVRIWEFSPR